VRDAYPKSYVRKMGLLAQHESLTQKVQAEQGQWEHIEKIRLALSGAPPTANRFIETGVDGL